MASVTVKGIPEHLHTVLKLKAKASRRSLNQEIVVALEQYVRRPTDEERFETLDAELAHFAAIRGLSRKKVSNDFIDRARKEGRS